eukprot:TRINITY_DN10963_c1_g1_i5.p4 TRINITY_DN10963_c1_g1~~TRINITY_DN10963_c1_g1_i5.p4  ORF type:complete len:113 (+),score=9.99 TRINITY_DN10963_c1_g1_i5:49-387(+)
MATLRASAFTGTKVSCTPRRAAPVIDTKIRAAKQLEGKVVSTKMQQTAVVLVESYVMEPRYGKRVLRSKKFKVHDENEECEEGDFVAFKEIPRMSKTKAAALDRIIRKVVKL